MLGAWVLIAACSAHAAGSSDRHSRSASRGDARSAEGPVLRVGATQRGKASWYGKRYHGRKTASGERFDSTALTAAHRTLPFGTKVRVKNLDNGRTVDVHINDRGPFRRKERIIDVSEAAAQQLRIVGSGVAPILLEVLALPAGVAARSARPASRAAP